MDTPINYISKLAPTLSFALSGGFATVSLMTIPAFLSAPPQMSAKQFGLIYRISAKTQPPLTLLTALTHGYVAYRLYRAPTASHGGWKLWALSGGLVGAILPWTCRLMEPVSRRILALGEVAVEEGGGKGQGLFRAKRVNVVENGEVFALLRKWDVLNMGRVALALAAGAVAMVRL